STVVIAATSRECVMYHLPSNSRSGLYLNRPSSASVVVGSRLTGRRGSRRGRGMAMMELEEGRVQRSWRVVIPWRVWVTAMWEIGSGMMKDWEMTCGLVGASTVCVLE